MRRGDKLASIRRPAPVVRRERFAGRSREFARNPRIELAAPPRGPNLGGRHRRDSRTLPGFRLRVAGRAGALVGASQASARWHAALAELRAAAVDYGIAANGLLWLNEFDPIRARDGDVPRLGSRVDVDTSRLSRNEYVQPVQKLLDLLAEAI